MGWLSIAYRIVELTVHYFVRVASPGKIIIVMVIYFPYLLFSLEWPNNPTHLMLCCFFALFQRRKLWTMIPSTLFNHLRSYDNYILTIQSHCFIKHSYGEKEGEKKKVCGRLTGNSSL